MFWYFRLELGKLACLIVYLSTLLLEVVKLKLEGGWELKIGLFFFDIQNSPWHKGGT